MWLVLGLFGSAPVWVAPPEAWLTGGSCQPCWREPLSSERGRGEAGGVNSSVCPPHICVPIFSFASGIYTASSQLPESRRRAWPICSYFSVLSGAADVPVRDWFLGCDDELNTFLIPAPPTVQLQEEGKQASSA